MEISPHEREVCLRVLQQISEDPSVINDDERMKALVAKIHTQGKKGQRRTARETRAAFDRDLRATTLLVQQQRERAETSRSALTLPAAPQSAALADSQRSLSRAALCYVCKQPYAELHWFYHQLCPDCATFNWQKRTQRADLRGRTALLTGGRIKIGYEVALRLLRDGASVLLTTRFARDAARRFGAETDFAAWRDRLQIFGLDLRDLSSVEAFAAHLLETQPHLDIVIHNAAQTVKRPLAFYQHLLDAENALALPDGAQMLIANGASPNRAALLERHPLYPGEAALQAHFPHGQLDADGQQFDARPHHSWRRRLHEISTLEMLEVHLVNAVAPFVLNAKLKPLLLRSPHPRRFIVNVSAMEGQFYRRFKTDKHPHTNMAKAALNMMTRTSASEYAKDGIHMNSVDTGWVTDEDPAVIAARKVEEQGFSPPLDIVDGAARIVAPIFDGLSTGEHAFGLFYKDYKPTEW